MKKVNLEPGSTHYYNCSWGSNGEKRTVKRIFVENDVKKIELIQKYSTDIQDYELYKSYLEQVEDAYFETKEEAIEFAKSRDAKITKSYIEAFGTSKEDFFRTLIPIAISNCYAEEYSDYEMAAAIKVKAEEFGYPIK